LKLLVLIWILEWTELMPNKSLTYSYLYSITDAQDDISKTEHYNNLINSLSKTGTIIYYIE